MKGFCASFERYLSLLGYLVWIWIASILAGMSGVLSQALGADPHRMGMNYWLPICFTFLALAPFWAFHKLSKESDAIKAQNAVLESKYPQMAIEFRDNDNLFVDDKWNVIYLTCDSKSRTVRDCKLLLVGLDILGAMGGGVTETPLSMSGRPFPPALGDTGFIKNEGPSRDIHSGGRELIRVARQEPGANALRIGDHRWDSSFTLRDGAYRHSLRAIGEDARPGELRLAAC